MDFFPELGGEGFFVYISAVLCILLTAIYFAICNLLIICCVHNLILTFLSETLMKKNENKQNSLLKFRPT